MREQATPKGCALASTLTGVGAHTNKYVLKVLKILTSPLVHRTSEIQSFLSQISL